MRNSKSKLHKMINNTILLAQKNLPYKIKQPSANKTECLHKTIEILYEINLSKMSWSLTNKLHAAMMRLRNQTGINRSNYKQLHHQQTDDNNGVLYTSSDEKNIIQRYWPCLPS